MGPNCHIVLYQGLYIYSSKVHYRSVFSLNSACQIVRSQLQQYMIMTIAYMLEGLMLCGRMDFRIFSVWYIIGLTSN